MEIEQKDPLGAVFSLIESAAKHNNKTLKSQGQGERHCRGLIRHCLLYVSGKNSETNTCALSKDTEKEVLSSFAYQQDRFF